MSRCHEKYCTLLGKDREEAFSARNSRPARRWAYARIFSEEESCSSTRHFCFVISLTSTRVVAVFCKEMSDNRTARQRRIADTRAAQTGQQNQPPTNSNPNNSTNNNNPSSNPNNTNNNVTSSTIPPPPPITTTQQQQTSILIPRTSTTTSTTTTTTTPPNNPPPPIPKTHEIISASVPKLRSWLTAWGQEYPGEKTRAQTLLIDLIHAQKAARKSQPAKRALDDKQAGIPPGKRTKINDGSASGKQAPSDKDLTVSIFACVHTECTVHAECASAVQRVESALSSVARGIILVDQWTG